MYAGAIKNGDGSTKRWTDMTPEEWAANSVFSFKQDTRLLGKNIVPSGSQMWKDLVEKIQHQY